MVADLIAGYARFLFFRYDVPAHFAGEFPAGFPLHRDVRLV